jgi:hypothetical protein
MSIVGKISVVIRTMVTMPSKPTRIASTVNVYGRRSANRTIHILSQISQVLDRSHMFDPDDALLVENEGGLQFLTILDRGG